MSAAAANVLKLMIIGYSLVNRREMNITTIWRVRNVAIRKIVRSAHLGTLIFLFNIIDFERYVEV
jgi:hypothetical protein